MSYEAPNGVAYFKVSSPTFQQSHVQLVLPLPVLLQEASRHLHTYFLSDAGRVSTVTPSVTAVRTRREFLPLEGMDLNMHGVQYVEK